MNQHSYHSIRIGGPVFCSEEDPERWAATAHSLGYRAVYAPQVNLDDKARIKAFVDACAKYDLLIAEVGRWNNLMDWRPEQREQNIQTVIKGLALAEELGAKCCVDILGSFSRECWFGPHPKNLTDEFLELGVENARRIIDAVHPKRTKFAYEMSGWSYPNEPDGYLRLIRAIDRKEFGVHLDVGNMINCPSRFWNTTSLINDTFDKLGDKLTSCHMKDLSWTVEMNIHFTECVIGEGTIDNATILRRTAALPVDVPLMIEHQKSEEDYLRCRDALFHLAEESGIIADGRKMS